MLKACESFAMNYHITFNPITSKSICYNVDFPTCFHIHIKNEQITVVNSDEQFGNFIFSDI